MQGCSNSAASHKLGGGGAGHGSDLSNERLAVAWPLENVALCGSCGRPWDSSMHPINASSAPLTWCQSAVRLTGMHGSTWCGETRRCANGGEGVGEGQCGAGHQCSRALAHCRGCALLVYYVMTCLDSLVVIPEASLMRAFSMFCRVHMESLGLRLPSMLCLSRKDRNLPQISTIAHFSETAPTEEAQVF